MAGRNSGHFHIIQFVINIVIVNVIVIAQVRNLDNGLIENFFTTFKFI